MVQQVWVLSPSDLKAKWTDIDIIKIVSLNVLYIKYWVILLFDSLFLWQEGAPEAWAHVFSLIKFVFNEL